MSEVWRWGFLICVGFILLCVVFVRQAHREDREEERLKQLERTQYDKRKKNDGNDSDGVEISTGGAVDEGE